MDSVSVAESRAERMIAACMKGAESGMIEVRGDGLTASEREEAERTARDLYGETSRP